MKKCPNCGALMKSDVNFCTKCGTDLRDISNAQINQGSLQQVSSSQLKPNTAMQDSTQQNPNHDKQQATYGQANQIPRQDFAEQTSSRQEQTAGQYQDVNAERKEKLHNYWQWCIESWKHPFSDFAGENWYGWATLLAEDIVLVLGIYLGMKSLANRYNVGAFGLGNTVSGIAFNTTIGLLFFSVLFQVIVIGGYYVSYLFIYGKGRKILDFVNCGVRNSNLNLILTVLIFVFMLMGSGNGSLAILLFLISIANLFMGFQVTTLSENLNPVRDKMYGYIISFFIIVIALMILISFIYNSAYNSVLNQLFSSFR